MFTDTHCHLSKEDYENINEVIERAKENKIERLIICGCDKKGIEESIEIANSYDNVYLEIGFHPSEANITTDEDIIWLDELITNNKKVIAVGEIGLDYHWDKENKDKQKELFRKMIKLSQKHNLPVVIHSRDAFQDTYDILKETKVKGDIHCFSGNLDNAKMYIDLGFILGIGGVLTFKNTNLKETIKNIDLDKIILETDSPYLSPEPFRGKQNEPKNVYYVAEEISRIKGEPLEYISKITEENIMRVFGI
jgi:TatD DNase family protein